jgi:hypothetical protein
MKKITIHITIILLLTSCSIKQKIEVGGDWSGYDYSYFCPSYCFSENGGKSNNLNVLDANHISLAGIGCNIAIEKANEYIKQRGGQVFFNKLVFYDIDITYLDSVKRFDNKRPLYNLDKCGETKYYIRYVFLQERSELYRFGIALNEKLEVISKKSFPDINRNPEFYNVINPYKAYRIAIKKNKSIIKPIKSIELVYEENTDSFVWELIKEEDNDNQNEYEIGMIKINATTGEILNTSNNKGKRIINKSW